jgi:ribosomal subunit interface protein
MKVTVSGKQVEIGDASPEYAEDRLEEVVDKFFDSSLDSSVTLSRAVSGLRIDITAHPGRGIIVQSHGEAETAHLAFDIAMEKSRNACAVTNGVSGITSARKNPKPSRNPSTCSAT